MSLWEALHSALEALGLGNWTWLVEVLAFLLILGLVVLFFVRVGSP